MTFDFEKFCRERGVRHLSEGHKHTHDGWIQVRCPFCTGHEGWHLGWCVQEEYFTCWRCGFHLTVEVLGALARCGRGEAGRLWALYTTGRTVRAKQPTTHRGATTAQLPADCGPVGRRHRQWLYRRRFNPQKLIYRWGLLATGPMGYYKHRIIAPVYSNKQLLTWQGRDITERSRAKYLPCPQEQECVPHKHWLYGLDELRREQLDRVLVMEGVTDVWRVGVGAVATFGICWTPTQAQLLTTIPHRFILYDTEAEAQLRARELCACLSAFPGETHIVELDEGDPADLTQEQAKELRLQVGFK